MGLNNVIYFTLEHHYLLVKELLDTADQYFDYVDIHEEKLTANNLNGNNSMYNVGPPHRLIARVLINQTGRWSKVFLIYGKANVASATEQNEAVD